MLIRPAVAGLTERAGTLHPGQWRPVLRRAEWDAVRTVLLDPARDTRTFRRTAARTVLGGLL